MMITIKTLSGSMYQFDQDAKRVRRLSGDQAPTSRFGEDGVWRTYEQTEPPVPQVGKPVYIVWYIDELPDGAIARGTLTSNVLEVKHESKLEVN